MMKEWLKGPFLEADGASAGSAGTDASGETENEAAEEKEKTSFDELLKDKDYQSEFDKRIAKALDTARGKWDAEQQARIEEEKRLSKLSAEQKAAEKQKAAEERVAQLEREKTEILLRQDTMAILGEKGLPAAFVDFLVGEDAESTNENIKSFEGAFRKAVEQAVAERLKTNAPRVGSADAGNAAARAVMGLK